MKSRRQWALPTLRLNCWMFACFLLRPRQMAGAPGFLPALLRVVGNPEVGPAMQEAAAGTFHRCVQSGWDHGAGLPSKWTEEEKVHVRSQVLEVCMGGGGGCTRAGGAWVRGRARDSEHAPSRHAARAAESLACTCVTVWLPWRWW